MEELLKVFSVGPALIRHRLKGLHCIEWPIDKVNRDKLGTLLFFAFSSPEAKRERKDSEVVDLTQSPELVPASEQAPVYCSRAMHTEEVLHLFANPSEINLQRVRVQLSLFWCAQLKYIMLFQLCTRVPSFCPGRGNWTFVVDLTNIDPQDIGYDEYGKWGRPCGQRIYMQPDENGQLAKIAEGREPAAPWTILVRCNRYVHPSVSSGEFSKITYVARDHEEKIVIGYAAITYSVQVNPSEVKPLAYKTAKDQSSSFQRVKPSTRKLAKEVLASETPNSISVYKAPNVKRVRNFYCLTMS